MTAILDFQKRLLTDKGAREAFAKDPAGTLAALGVKLPAGIKVPGSIDASELERRIGEVREGLSAERKTVETVDKANTDSLIHSIENIVPVRTKDLGIAKAVHQTLGAGGDDATIAVVGAVVAAVVAVPVEVVGRSTLPDEVIDPAIGIERITRGAGGLTVHGPNGMRIEGMSVNEVASLIRSLR